MSCGADVAAALRAATGDAGATVRAAQLHVIAAAAEHRQALDAREATILAFLDAGLSAAELSRLAGDGEDGKGLLPLGHISSLVWRARGRQQPPAAKG